MSDEIKTFRFVKSEVIAAPAEIVWETIIEELNGAMGDNKSEPMGMRLEAVIGGKWWRDRGNGIAHLWGHVQVIKPGVLLELCGPMMMSFAATNHVQYKLTEDGKGTKMDLTHTAMGLIPDELAKGMTQGWGMISTAIREKSEKKTK